MVDVETIELFGKVNDMASYVTRFAKFCGKANGITESDDGLDDVVALVGRNCAKVDVAHIDVAAFAERACATSVSVLNVRRGFTVKVEHVVIVENYVFDTVGPNGLEHHIANADTRF